MLAGGHTRFTKKEISLLQALYSRGSPTRNEIARSAALSAASVTATLAPLIEADIVQRAGKAGTGSGRPSTVHRIAPTVGVTIGVPIDAGSFRIVAVDGAMQVLAEPSMRSPIAAGHERRSARRCATAADPSGKETPMTVPLDGS